MLSTLSDISGCRTLWYLIEHKQILCITPARNFNCIFPNTGTLPFLKRSLNSWAQGKCRTVYNVAHSMDERNSFFHTLIPRHCQFQIYSRHVSHFKKIFPFTPLLRAERRREKLISCADLQGGGGWRSGPPPPPPEFAKLNIPEITGNEKNSYFTFLCSSTVIRQTESIHKITIK